MILITGIITFTLTAAGTLSATAAAGMVFRAFVLFYRMAGAAPSAGGTAAFAAGFTPYRNARNERHEQYRYYYNNYLYRLHILSYPSPRPSAPEGADSRVMPIFIGYSHAPRFVLIGVASRRIRRPFCHAPVPASPKHFYRDLFCTFAYPLARRSAATTSLGATQICKKISTLKARVSDLLRLGVSGCNVYLSITTTQIAI